MSSSICVDSLLFSSPDVSDLKLPVKHYTCRNIETGLKRDGFTLLFAHASGMHKEQWEPCIDILLDGPKVQDAWSFDWPSHGHGAEINSEALRARERPMSTTEWAKLLAAFCKMFQVNATRAIAIGHSNGTSAFALSTNEFTAETLPYGAMILVEPVMIPHKVFLTYKTQIHANTHLISKMIAKRRETWKTKEEALSWLTGRLPWKRWDPRIVKLFVEHALSHDATAGVRIACDRAQEAYALVDDKPHSDAQDAYNAIAKHIPVHFVFGGIQCETSKMQIAAILDTSEGQAPAKSVQYIPEAGHLVLQERPLEVAHAILRVIDREWKCTPMAKL